MLGLLSAATNSAEKFKFSNNSKEFPSGREINIQHFSPSNLLGFGTFGDFEGLQRLKKKTEVELLVLYLNVSGVTAPKDLAYLLCNGSLQGGFDAIKV